MSHKEAVRFFSGHYLHICLSVSRIRQKQAGGFSCWTGVAQKEEAKNIWADHFYIAKKNIFVLLSVGLAMRSTACPSLYHKLVQTSLSAKQAALLQCQLATQVLNSRPEALVICFMGHIRTEI